MSRFRPLCSAAFAVALLLSSEADAACNVPSQNTDLLDSLETASVAFGNLEVEAFQGAKEKAEQHLECLNEPISRTTAAEYHRVSGLALFLDRNSPEAAKSFAAARAIEPAYMFPTDLIPEGNPVLDTYASLDPDAGEKEVVARPKAGSIKIDGSGSLNRNRSLPAIFQLFDGRGAVVQTTLLAAGDPLPTYEVGSNKGPAPTAKSGPNVPLLASAGASLAIAGGLYAGGAVSRSAWKKSTTVEGANSSRATTNTLVIASGVAGAAALGLGTTSFVLSGRF